MPTVALWTGGAASQELTSATNWSSVDTTIHTTGIVGTALTLVFPPMPASSAKNVQGGNYSTTTAITMSRIFVEDGCSIDFGSRDNPLRFYRVSTATGLSWAGRGRGNFAFNSCSSVVIEKCASSSTSAQFGLNIAGFAGVGTAAPITSVIVKSGGDIGLCGYAGDTGLITSLRVWSGNVTIGTGCGCTTIYQDGGVIHAHGGDNCTSMTITEGAFYLHQNALTGGNVILNVYGGTFYVLSSQINLSSVNLYGGLISFADSVTPKDWSTVTFNRYGGEIDDPGTVLTWPTTYNVYKGGRHSIT